jgi:glycosyltransferase involved in cell wall biosynthesis
MGNRVPGILIWLRSSRDLKGGAEILAERFASELMTRHYPVTIVSSRVGWYRPQLSHVTVRGQAVPIQFLPSPPTRLLGTIIYYCFVWGYMVSRFSQFRVVHIMSIARVTLPVIIFARLLRKKAICHIVGVYKYELIHPQNKKTMLIRLHLAWLRLANALVSESSEITSLLKNIGLNHPSLQVISNGVDIDYFRPGSPPVDDIRARLRISDRDIVVCWTGVIRPVKRVDVIVQAVGLLAECYSNLHLVLVGDGTIRQEVDKMVSALNLDGRVHVVGWVNDTLPFLQASDIYVLSSDAENHSNALMEAMACGLPVIVTDVGGNRDMIVDGENGLIVPPGDPAAMAQAIQRLITDPDLKTHLASNARRAAIEQYSIQHMADCYLKLYQFDGPHP